MIVYFYCAVGVIINKYIKKGDFASFVGSALAIATTFATTGYCANTTMKSVWFLPVLRRVTAAARAPAHLPSNTIDGHCKPQSHLIGLCSQCCMSNSEGLFC